jgi:peptidoglycan/LPS O-acetylase OafA/YrhL
MRIVILDLVRTVAICLLLAEHVKMTVAGNPFFVRWVTSDFRIALLSFGEIAVALFLLVSGLSLQIHYGWKKYTYADFQFKRLLRIYPVYYLCLIVGISVYCLDRYATSGLFLQSLPCFGLSDMLLCLTGFYAFAGQWGGPFIASSWFIGLIISLYFVFPPVSRAMVKTPYRTIAALLSISLIVRFFVGYSIVYPYELFRWFPPCRLAEFSLGIFIGVIVPPSLWKAANNKPHFIQKAFSFAGEISFPLFLVHAPLLCVIPILLRQGYNLALAIGLFLLLSVALSWIVLLIDRRIPKHKIFERLQRAIRSPASPEGPPQVQPPASGSA